MGFGTAIWTCFRKFFTYRGRAPRSEYWSFLLFAVLSALAVSSAEFAAGYGNGGGSLGTLVAFVLFFPQVSAAVRRLHDSNRSGWWVGGFYLYVFAALNIGLMVVFGPAGRGTPAPWGEIVPDALLGGVVLFAILMVVLLALKGTEGANKYGPDPVAGAV